MTDPALRFQDRVHHYARSRPGYPPEALEYLESRGALSKRSTVADVGSGTGILTALLLERADQVFAVEPGAEMASAAEHALSSRPGFRSVRGRAEATGLPDESVDLVVTGQSFHWFDPAAAAAEFRRILRDPPWLAILFNERDREVDAFARAYEAFLRVWQVDYDQVSEQFEAGQCLPRVYGSMPSLARFPNAQVLDRVGLHDRILSCSYMPSPGHPRFAAMQEALPRLFEEHQRGGAVTLHYETRVHLDRLRRT